MAKEFTGKVALVTAGGKGIGQASAMALAQNGATVMIGDIDEAAGLETVEAIRADGGTAEFTAADVTQEEAVKALVAKTLERFGRLDIAHNNAGMMYGSASFGDYSLEEWNRTLAISMTATWLCMREEIPVMISRGGGAIVNTSSMAAAGYSPDSNAAYCAAKRAVISLTEYAAAQYAKEGLRVNAVAPGLVRTSVVNTLFTPEQQREMASRTQRIGRIIEPSEIGEAVVFLCSERAAMITGIMLPVCGGSNIL